MLRYKKNPPGKRQSGEIEVDGKLYKAKYIGKGHYSKVFRVGDRVVYYTRGDCGKEVLSMFQYDRIAHLPNITRHENITTTRGVWHVFSSPYYRDVRKSDVSAWNMMKRIMEVSKAYSDMYYGAGSRDIYLMQAIVSSMKGHNSKYGQLPRSIIRALEEIVDVASNCGVGVRFDLHKKNFGVNEYGTLIFRDPIYVRE